MENLQNYTVKMHALFAARILLNLDFGKKVLWLLSFILLDISSFFFIFYSKSINISKKISKNIPKYH